MSNKRTPAGRPPLNGVDLGNQLSAAAERDAAQTALVDAYEQARQVDTIGTAKRLPSGHVMLPRFPDGELVTIDAKRVAMIEPAEPQGWVDLSKLGEERPSVCQVTYEYGVFMLVGTVEQITLLLLGDGEIGDIAAQLGAGRVVPEDRDLFDVGTDTE